MNSGDTDGDGHLSSVERELFEERFQACHRTLDESMGCYAVNAGAMNRLFDCVREEYKQPSTPEVP